MSYEIAVQIPDSTGGHNELYYSITDQLGQRLGQGYPVFPWGLRADGSAGYIGPQFRVTAIAPDGSSIVPISTPGAGFLLNNCPLNVIFGGTLGTDQQAVLQKLGISCGGVNIVTGAPVTAGPTNTGTTQQGGLTTFVPPPQTNSVSNSTVAAAISTSITPGAPGSIPSGGGQTNAPPNLQYIYRFILNSAPGRYDTGANYPGCSQVNTSMCDPQQFTTLQAAIAYAQSRNEIPYIASSASEVWGIIGGTVRLDPSKIYGASSGIPWGLIAAGVAAFFVLKK